MRIKLVIGTKASCISSRVLKSPQTLLLSFRVQDSVGDMLQHLKKKIYIPILQRLDGADPNSLNSRDRESLKWDR